MTVLLLFSSLHSFSTWFRSEDWNGHSRSSVLCSVTHFCVVFKVCIWIIVRLEDPNMAHYKISYRVSHLLIFYLLVFDRIHDAMHLNKMSRTSSRNIGPQHHKYSSIFHCTHGELFIHVFTKHILGPILTIWNASVKARSASNFVGGSRRCCYFPGGINGSCARRKSKMGWSEVASLFIGVVWA